MGINRRLGAMLAAMFLVSAAGLLVQPSMAVQAGFSALQAYAAGVGPDHLVAGDFTGDGKPDLLVADDAGYGSLHGYLLKNNGSGGFLAATQIAMSPVLDMATGDLNGDGKLDVAVRNGTAVNLLLGNGDGTFASGTAIPAPPANFGAVAVADLTNDGKLDLVIASPGFGGFGSALTVALGKGDGTFPTSKSIDGATAPDHPVVADVNGDGKPDLMVITAASVSVMRGNADGTFLAPTVIAFGTRPAALVAADVNGDGHIDVVAIGCGDFGSSAGGICVAPGHGDGTFGSVIVTQTLSQNYQAAAAVDWNADGTPDLAVAGLSGVLAEYVGDGAGSFALATSFSFANSAYPPGLAVRDLNADGLPDVAVTETYATPPAVGVALRNPLPTAPVGVAAEPWVGAATVSWHAPLDNGGAAITGYTITSSGGATLSVGPTVTSAVIAGLAPDPHTFTVTATNAAGTSAASSPSNSVTPLDGGTYRSVTPARILDTRNGTGGVPVRRLNGGQTLDLKVTGGHGVPDTGVGAVLLNVTVTGTTAAGYVTVFPTGVARPLASNLNFVAGQTVPNLVEVAVGTNGQVSFFDAGGAADLIADVQGWVGDSTDSYGRAGLFNPLPPARIMDTRAGTGGVPKAKLGPGQSLTLQVSGDGNVPIGASAIVVNVTATDPTMPSYLTVYPAGASRPVASNLNFIAGQTIANRVMVGLSAAGGITIFNPSGSVNVIADVNGWFTSAASTDGGTAFVGTVPTRIFDTRDPSCSCPLAPGDVLDIYSTVPSPPSALVMNVTATGPTAPSYLTVYPDDGSHGYGPVPLASDVNFGRGQTVPNLTVVKLGGSDGAFNIYNPAGTVDAIVDVTGYYGPRTPAPPAGLTAQVRAERRSGARPSAPSRYREWTTRN